MFATTWPTETLPGHVSLIILGGLVVWLSAELLVRGASRLALRLGLTPFIIGATVLAFGTSAPELIVSITAHWNGSSALSLGNVLGSNVCNLGLVLGLTALLLSIRVRPLTLKRELPLVLLAEVLFCLLALDQRLSLGDGIVFLVAFFLIYAYLILPRSRATPGRPEKAGPEPVAGRWGRDLVFAVTGVVGLFVGARMFVRGAAAFATALGMSQSAVGATVVAVGTSLPELVTSVVAALRGHLDISVGNLLGSNLFNTLLVGGSLATIAPVPVSAADFFHVWWMIGITVAVFPTATYARLFDARAAPRIDRLGGMTLTLAYAVYVFYSLALH